MSYADELFDLTGKVAVITGGAGGIGLVYADALCQCGAAVVVADVNGDAAQRTAKDLVDKGHRAVGCRWTSRRSSPRKPWPRPRSMPSAGIDILVNNAAIMTDLPPYGLSNMPVERVGPRHGRQPARTLLCTQAVLESMTARGGGRIVNGLSAGAFMAGGIYGVSKYALHGLTCNLASELGGREHQRQRHRARARRQRERLRQPSQGLAIPRRHRGRDPGQEVRSAARPRWHVAVAVLEAGDWITGQTISVDGGWVMRL